MKNKVIKTTIIISFILILGLFLRIYNLDNQSYWMDEGITINAILSILENGDTTLDSGENYFCPLYCYPTAYVTKIFGKNAFSYRFISVISGILLIMLFIKKLPMIFNINIALLSSIFLTFSYWQIAWSRQARWYTLFALLSWIAIFYFYDFLYKNHKKNNLIIVLISIIASILVHRLGFILLCALFFWYIIYLIQTKKGIKYFKQNIYILLSFLLLILLSEVFFSYFEILITKFGFNYSLPYYLNFFIRKYWLFILLSIFALFSVKKNKKLWYIIFPFIFQIILIGIFSNIVHYRYLFNLTPALYILGAIGIDELTKHFKNVQSWIIYLIVITIFFISGHGVMYPQNFYFLESDNPDTLNRNYYAYTPQPNFTKAYKVVKEKFNANNIIISTHPQFNKIFLNENGYWIKYDYIGLENFTRGIKNDREHYVNAIVIDDLNEFINITNKNHGYVIFDFMATQNRVPENILNYIKDNFSLIFQETTNSYSQIWVYEF